MFNTSLFDGHTQFLHQNVDDGIFERRGQVLLMMLNEIGFFLYPLLQAIEERCLQSRKRVVETRYVGFGEFECLWIAILSESVDDWSAGIAESHYL